RFRNWSDGSFTHTNHYSGDGDVPAWTSESATTYSRGVSAFVGLGAIQTNTSGTNTTKLQVQNLHGDIVAQALTTDSALPSTTQETTEYGLSRSGLGQRYDYLGSASRARDDLSGVTLMGARMYDAATGAFTSKDSVTGGSANAYD